MNVFDHLRDPVSSVTHLLTALWALFATLMMLRLAPSGRRLPFLIYGCTMVLLFTASGLFHGVMLPESERWFYSRLDHSAIYLLIAGTNTPALSVLLSGAWRKWCLTLVWGLALLGFATMWIFPKPPHALNISFFLTLGWLGVVPVVQYYRAVGWRAMNWVWLGAGLYSIGAVCELTKWPVIVPGYVQAHEVMHFFHSAACVCFFIFAARYVLHFRHKDPVTGERATIVQDEHTAGTLFWFLASTSPPGYAQHIPACGLAGGCRGRKAPCTPRTMLRRPRPCLVSPLGEGCSSTAIATWRACSPAVWDNPAGRGSAGEHARQVAAVP